MNAKDLIISIKSKFDGKGTADAKQQLDATSKSAEQVGKSAQKSGSEISSGMGKAGGGIAQLSKGISGLQKVVTGFGILGIIGAITTAYNLLMKVSSWIKDKLTANIRAAGEASLKLSDSLSDRKMQLAQQMVDNVTTSYDRAASAIDKANTAQQQYLAALQDLNTAQQEATSLELDRRELAALASLQDGDAAGEAAVKARFGKMRLSDSLGQRGAKAIRGEQSAQDELTAASSRRAQAAQSLSDAQQTRAVLADQLEYTASQVNQHPDTGKPGFRGEWAEKQNAKDQKVIEVFTAKISELDSTIVKLSDILSSQTANERAAAIRLQAARVRSTGVLDAATALSQQQSTDIDRGTERDRWSARMGDMRTRASSASSTLGTYADRYRADSNAYDPQRGDYPHQGAWNSARIRDRQKESGAKEYERLAASAKTLDTQLSTLKPEQLATVFDSISRKLATLEQAIKNAEARSKRQ